MALVELLLKNDANLNLVDKSNGQTALHYCVARKGNANDASNRLKIAKLLIENGAAQNVLDKFGNNPLQLAVQIGKTKGKPKKRETRKITLNCI